MNLLVVAQRHFTHSATFTYRPTSTTSIVMLPSSRWEIRQNRHGAVWMQTRDSTTATQRASYPYEPPF